MEGIVLRRIDYGESDQIIKLFLKETGNISSIAKGIKRSKKRFPHRLEPFRVYDFTLRKRKPGQSLYLIQSADQIRDFEGIKEDIRKIALGNFILEILLIAVKESHPHPELYDFVLKTFRNLSESEGIFPLWFYVAIHVMGFLGFSPNFETCLKCKKPLQKTEKNLFNPARGGLVCQQCATLSKTDKTSVTSEALGVLQFLKKASFPAVPRIKLSSQTRTEIASLLTNFITYHLERPLKTLPFLQEVLLKKK